MPQKKRSSTRRRRSGFRLIRGKRPHAQSVCHTVPSRWPYVKSWLCWAGFHLSVLFTLRAFYMAVTSKQAQYGQLLVAGLASTALMALVTLLARRSCRCPLCRAYSLIPGSSQKHEKAYRVFPFSYTATSMLTMFFQHKLRCLHCGTPFDLKKKRRRG